MTLFLFLALNIILLAAAAAYLVFLTYTLVIAAYKGSPYAPTKSDRMEHIFALADARPGELLVDLGSGNGAVLLAAAERGIRSRGVEINPFWVWYSRWRIAQRGFTHLATVVRGNMFTHPVADADIIFLFLVPVAMALLSERLRREASPRTRIIAHRFILPGWTPVKQKETILLYQAKLFQTKSGT